MRTSDNAHGSGKAPPRPVPGLGERLYQARRHASRPGREISQSEAGAVVGKTGVAVGRWEAGKLEPSLMDIVGLAMLYGADPADLAFGGKEERVRLVEAYEAPNSAAPRMVAEAITPYESGEATLPERARVSMRAAKAVEDQKRPAAPSQKTRRTKEG